MNFTGMTSRVEFNGLVSHGEPATYFTFRSLTELGIPHATTTRHFSAVTSPAEKAPPFQAEAAAALRDVGLDLSRLTYARQVHGADVAVAPPGGGFAGAVDVIATRERAVPLAIFTADCLAITLCDRDASALVVAHAGWRGTVRGAAPVAVGALRGAGGRPAAAAVTIAPSIGPCCYEVDEPVIGALSAAYPDRWERWVASSGPGHWMLDLWAANEELLVEAGIDAARIDNPRVCTACHPELLYSYRKGNRGRLVTVAALP